MRRHPFGGVALSLVLAASSHGAAQDAGMPRTTSERTITIRIHNYAEVKPSVLLPATKVAGDILRDAGVDSVWVECIVGQTELPEAACEKPVTPLDLVLNLLSRSQAQHLHFHDKILGVAAEPTGEGFGVFASVFYDNAKDCAAQWQLNLPQLLWLAIAHELAHLLLGTNSHSSHGVMRAFWSGKELLAAGQRDPSFSSSEKNRLQTTLSARTLAALREVVSLELPHSEYPNGSVAAMR
jgi:hypothetical protein